MAAHGNSQDGRADKTVELDAFERAVVDLCLRDFPLVARPYAVVAERLGVAEHEVIATLDGLVRRGVVDRLGATLRPHSVGWSTLAALAVPEERLEDVAALVSSFPEVNHNYERDHEINLWFVVTAVDEVTGLAVLDAIAERTGFEPLRLPLEQAFCLDLGFALP